MKWVVLTFSLVVGTATSVEYYSYGTSSDFDKLTAKCLKLTVARDAYKTCVKRQANGNEFQKDIENAKLTGNLDSVFGKYCRKTSTVISCIEDLLSAVDPCLETIKKEYKDFLTNMAESLTHFLCYENHGDGERITMFFVDGGFECIQDKEEVIKGCVNEILEKYNPTDVDNLPLLKIEKEECDHFTAIRTCVVTKLKGCPKSTAAIFVEALFEIIEKDTNCEKLKSKSVSFNNANIVIKVFMYAIMLFVRYF